MLGPPKSGGDGWMKKRCSIPRDIDVQLRPGDNVKNIVDNSPQGTKFLFKAGTYRLASIQAKSGMEFYGELDSNCRRLAILSGARVLRNPAREGRFYVYSNQTQEGYVNPKGLEFCEQGWERCRRPENVYINDRFIRHVSSKAQLVSGTWFFDYAANKIYLVDNPSGKKVEASVTPLGIHGGATNVKVIGLIFEKYASPYQHNIIQVGNSSGVKNWHIEYNDFRMGHGGAIKAGLSTKVLHNRIRHFAMKGMSAGGGNGLIEGNEIAHNGFAMYRWGSGGTKFAVTTNLTIRRNCVHHNHKNGLWTDIKNKNALYEENVIFRNGKHGIDHEISYDAVIKNNLIGLNGDTGRRGSFNVAAIYLQTSRNVEVFGNYIEVAGEYGNGLIVKYHDRANEGDYSTENNNLHNNVINFLGPVHEDGINGYKSFVSQTQAKAKSNKFFNNTYHMPNANAKRWVWHPKGGSGAKLTLNQFKAHGQGIGSKIEGPMPAIDWSCNLVNSFD